MAQAWAVQRRLNRPWGRYGHDWEPRPDQEYEVQVFGRWVPRTGPCAWAHGLEVRKSGGVM
jgi:hypothetical protein